MGNAVKAISSVYDSEFVFNIVRCDLRNTGATLDIVAKYKPDAILHLAAVSGGVGLSIKYPAGILRDNVLMTFSILEAARKFNVKKTIMTLSTGMYPPNAPLPLKEEYIHNGYPHDSNYSYSFAKRIIDPAIKAYRDEYKLNVIGLIPAGIFGNMIILTMRQHQCCRA